MYDILGDSVLGFQFLDYVYILLYVYILYVIYNK